MNTKPEGCSLCGSDSHDRQQCPWGEDLPPSTYLLHCLNIPPSPHTGGFMFEVGQTYTTKQGDAVTVLGRTTLKSYECLECSDGRYRYDRSTGSEDAGRCTGTAHDYTYRHNFQRPDKSSVYYAEDGTLMTAPGKRSIFDDVDE